MCGSMVDIQSATAEIRRGIKKDRKIERNYRMKLLWSALLHRATIKKELECGPVPNLMVALLHMAPSVQRAKFG